MIGQYDTHHYRESWFVTESNMNSKERIYKPEGWVSLRPEDIGKALDLFRYGGVIHAHAFKKWSHWVLSNVAMEGLFRNVSELGLQREVEKLFKCFEQPLSNLIGHFVKGGFEAPKLLECFLH